MHKLRMAIEKLIQTIENIFGSSPTNPSLTLSFVSLSLSQNPLHILLVPSCMRAPTLRADPPLGQPGHLPGLWYKILVI
jgi:hypothetical protein